MNRFARMGTIAAVLFAAVVIYLCLFSQLGTLGLVGPDEPRYAEIAREMAKTGDWVTPYLYGQPWFEKPPLYYWSAALAFRALGTSEVAARLPSALAALVTALALAWAARRLYGLGTAWVSLLIFPTSVGIFGFARAATTDMLFSTSLALATLAALFVVRNAKPVTSPEHCRMVPLAVFGGALALAALAKGPAAIVLAGGSVGLWTLVTRRWREAFRLLHPAAIMSFCIVVLPWYVLCAVRNSGFVRTFLFLHNVERYLTPYFRHVQPWWFFGSVLSLGMLPWTPLLVAVARDGMRLIRRPQWKDSAGLFLACWVVFPVAFFSFSESKLPGYVLPTVPPLVLLMARSLSYTIEQNRHWARWLLGIVSATWIALGLSAGYWLRRLPSEWVATNHQGIVVWICVALAGGALVAMLGWLSKPWVALAGMAALVAALLTGITQQFLPHLDPYLSPRAVAHLPRPLSGTPEKPVVYRLSRAWHYGLNFYLGENLAEWAPEELTLRKYDESAAARYVYTNDAGLVDLARKGWAFGTIQRVSPRGVLALARRPLLGSSP